MSSSSRERRRAAFSIIEVLVCLVILALSLVPIIDMFMSSSRMGVSARRMVDVSLFGQTILEGLAMLEPEDLPDIPANGSRILLDGDQVVAGGSPRFQEAATYFRDARPKYMEECTVNAERQTSGVLLLTIDLKWQGVPSDARTMQSTSLQVLTPPRKWL